MYGKHSDGTTWGAWMAFGGYLASDAVPVADGTGLVHVFVVGGDGALYTIAIDPTALTAAGAGDLPSPSTAPGFGADWGPYAVLTQGQQ